MGRPHDSDQIFIAPFFTHRPRRDQRPVLSDDGGGLVSRQWGAPWRDPKKTHRAKNRFPLWISWCLSNLSKVLDFWTLKNGILVLLRNATLTYPEEPSLKVEEDEEPFLQGRGSAVLSFP